MANTLFGEQALAITPAKDRREPLVWVRRVRLVETLSPDGKDIREEILFRRGVNIICTEKSTTQDRSVVGHNVGKTLLLRLIRYCLGEPTFCRKAVRGAIAGALKDAYVLAEIHVAGKPWVVARPMGLDVARVSSWVQEGDDFGLLRQGQTKAANFSAFTDALEDTTKKAFADVRLSHVDRQAGWGDMLAWMSRDQECRYRHQSEWRDPESESRVPQLQLEDASLVMRMAMDLLGRDERKLQVAHQKLLAEKRTLEGEVNRLDIFLQTERTELKAVTESEKDIDGGTLFAGLVQDAARDKRRQLMDLLKEQKSKDTVGQLDMQRQGLITELAQLQERRNKASGEHDAEQTVLEQLKAADTDTFYSSYAPLAQQWCRLFQTSAEAKAHGCPGEPIQLKAGERDPQHARAIEQCERRVVDLASQIAMLDGEVAEKASQLKKALCKYQAELKRHLDTIGGIQTRMGRWEEIEKRAKRYGEYLETRAKKHTSLEALEKRIRESNESLAATRGRMGQRQRDISSYFDYVLKSLLGPSAGGEIRLESRGMIPRPNQNVAASGEALSTSAMVLGFDLACLIAYICGIGYVPGLLIHDSPREADMEDTLYNRLFYLAQDLESHFESEQASFQYIVATTTPPPQELDRKPYVCLRLNARDPGGLLLGRRFAVQ